MRTQYPTSRETIRVLSQAPKAIAEKMGCDPSYISQIIRGISPDPFPRFERVREAAIDAHVDVSEWDDKMKAAKEKDAIKQNIIDHWLNTVEAIFDVLKEMGHVISDGVVDQSECRRVMPKISKAEDLLGVLYKSVAARVNE
jgi:transcriptional regulator with XRE-family HTH domain